MQMHNYNDHIFFNKILYLKSTYYRKATGNQFPVVCAWCATKPSTGSLNERENLLNQFSTCLPLCEDRFCRQKGWVTRGKQKAMKNLKERKKLCTKNKIASQKLLTAKQSRGSKRKRTSKCTPQKKQRTEKLSSKQPKTSQKAGRSIAEHFSGSDKMECTTKNPATVSNIKRSVSSEDQKQKKKKKTKK
jgi:hypothetical protein